MDNFSPVECKVSVEPKKISLPCELWKIIIGYFYDEDCEYGFGSILPYRETEKNYFWTQIVYNIHQKNCLRFLISEGSLSTCWWLDKSYIQSLLPPINMMDWTNLTDIEGGISKYPLARAIPAVTNLEEVKYESSLIFHRNVIDFCNLCK